MRKMPLIVPRQRTQAGRINFISLAQPLLAHLIPSVQRTQAARTKEIVLIMVIMFCLQSPWAAHFIHGYTGTLLKDRASCTSLVQKIIKIYRMSNTNWSPLSYIYFALFCWNIKQYFLLNYMSMRWKIIVTAQLNLKL